MSCLSPCDIEHQCYNIAMQPVRITKTTARRYILGRQGLWPGRRWAGKEGVSKALHQIEAVQLDPLNVVARSHDIALCSRVLDYQPDYLDQLTYAERRFFDYGGSLYIYPMSELRYWRLQMQRRAQEGRWADFSRQQRELLDEVRAQLRQHGPLGNRDFSGRTRINSYRARKDTGLALFAMWLTGELMIHHRRGFERVYDFSSNVVPQEMDKVVNETEAEGYFAQKALAFYGLVTVRGWKNCFSGFVHRPISRKEVQDQIEQFISDGVFAPVKIDGSKEHWLVLADDLLLLTQLEADQVPDAWQPLQTTTDDEVTFLAPLDIVSARGRSKWLFDFDYVWEVYKPVEQRRWGYYVLPILYGDRLVARLDPKLDRKTNTLEIKGFWLEDERLAKDEAFLSALANGLVRFVGFLGANSLDISAIRPSGFRARIEKSLRANLEIVG